ncbi:MAG: pilus assembly protein FimV [Moritella sp.]|jgi:pilus assembly protein FimV
MLLNFSKFKWLVLLLLLPITGMAANTDGFVLQLKGPQVQTPSSPTSYGPVAKSDTLWSIAKATRPNARLNLYQTMAAIVALNPYAFLDGDINRIIDGSILKIPSAAQIRATDGAQLQQALNQPVKTQPAKSMISTKTVTNTSNPAPIVRAVAGGKNNKLTQLQGELAESNEHLLVSSETNRRLKLQLESIRVELAALKQQMELDNQLRAELSALIKQQKDQLDLQQAQIDEVTNQAEIDETNNSKSWLIIGVAGVFILLSLVWLGLWLKNRHDQKMHAEDAAIFDADNAVDELSDYLTAENYTASEQQLNDADQLAAESAEPVNTLDMLSSEGEADFNRQLPDEFEMTDGTEAFADGIAVSEPIDVDITTSDPVIPDIIEQMPEFSATTIDDNNFSDIDLTLDDAHTSFENDTITPDLSWRDELDSDETTLADVAGLIPAQTAADDDASDMDNPLDADLAEIDDMLAQYRPNDQSIETEAFDTGSETITEREQQSQTENDTIANQVTDTDEIDSLIAEAELTAKTAASTETEDLGDDAELPQSYGQTVDEMLAELDNSELDKVELDNVEFDSNSVSVDVDSTLEEANSTVKEANSVPVTPDNGAAQANAENTQEPDAKPQPASKDNQLDDIEAMLAEFSPNAFSNDASEQAPIDQAAAKQEEFIDIDKLLNESAQALTSTEEEPYDQVKLDVGLDEYSHTLLDHNDVDIDDDSNSIGAQLDLARAYLEIEDKEGAKSILDPLAGTGNAAQQAEVSKLLSRL